MTPDLAGFLLSELLEGDPVDARVDATRYARNEESIRKKMAECGTPQIDIDALFTQVHLLKLQPGELLAEEWDEFCCKTNAGVEAHGITPDESAISPRWPSGLPELDEITGGCYGITVVAGQKKLGKSMLGIGMGCEAAHAGIKTIYLNAEIPKVQLANRILRYCLGSIPNVVRENLRPIMVSPGATLERIRKLIGEEISAEDERMVIVVDSINSVVESLGDRDYFQGLRDVANMVAIPRKHTEGRISAVLISETNRHGGVKGAKLEYLADLILLLKPTEVPEVVEIEIDASRESSIGSNMGNLGSFYRKWKFGKFINAG